MYEGGSPFIVPRAESDNRQKTNSLFIDRTYVRFDWCLLRTRQSPVQCNFSFFKYVLVLLILFPPQKTIPPLTPTSKNFFLPFHHPAPPPTTLHLLATPLSRNATPFHPRQNFLLLPTELSFVYKLDFLRYEGL
jgi:hypothetical protein